MNGLAIGLGALYPNLKEDHPGKIVSGFGGTCCLVVSFLYVVAAVVLLAVGTPWPWSPDVVISPPRVAGCWGAFLLLSWAVGYWPLRLGLRQVRRFEV
jgi:ABC-2 type transport system permease protein